MLDFFYNLLYFSEMKITQSHMCSFFRETDETVEHNSLPKYRKIHVRGLSGKFEDTVNTTRNMYNRL